MPDRHFSLTLEVNEPGANARYAATRKTAGDLAHMLRSLADAIETKTADGETLPHAMIAKTLKSKGRKS